ncbi:hypothetical protein FQZ97_1047990 [compost metagenome]
MRRQHGALGVVAVVLDQQPQLAPVRPALRIEFGHAHEQAVAHVLAIARDRTREVENAAQDDLVLADALGLGRRRGARKTQDGGGAEARDPVDMHGMLLCSSGDGNHFAWS